MKVGGQTTLRDHTTLVGVGVHSGLPVTLTIHPADANTGLRFHPHAHRRPPLSRNPCRYGCGYCDRICHRARRRDRTAHLHFRARACGSCGTWVDNAAIEIDGPEAPIMDGSAAPFVAAIDLVGLETLSQSRRYIKVLKPVRVAIGDAFGEVLPNPRGFRVEAEIKFDHPLIGRQSIAVDVKPDAFRRDIARARTFGFMRDVTTLWNSGYALGASLENTLVVSENRILNPEGTRFPDEFVRHKVLDAIGDLALAGGPLLATYRSVRGGHKLNHAVLCALMSDASAWTWMEPDAYRPVRGYAELPSRLAPVFGPDIS